MTSESTSPKTYYFVAASQSFIESEPLQEILEERTRYYQENQRDVDFYLVKQPAFLDLQDLAALANRIKKPAVAVISTDQSFIRWLTVRLTFVESGEFQAPIPSLADPLASLAPTES